MTIIEQEKSLLMDANHVGGSASNIGKHSNICSFELFIVFWY